MQTSKMFLFFSLSLTPMDDLSFETLMHTEILLRPHVHPSHVSAFLNCLHIVNSRAKTGISDVTCMQQSNLCGTDIPFITTLMDRRSVYTFKSFQLCTTYLNIPFHLHFIHKAFLTNLSSRAPVKFSTVFVKDVQCFSLV
jgi:hypothetical protein